MTTRICRCGDPRDDHEDGGKCSHAACGCDSFRRRPAVADEAESWLASRTPGTGQGAARGEHS
jgi:hypothetical protein